MSDDLLKSLGRIGREEREASEAGAEKAPAISEIAREKMVSRALQELAAEQTETKPPSNTKVLEAKQAKSSRRMPIALVASGLALAAAIALWVGTRKDDLPGYDLAVRGGTSEWRTTADGGDARRIEVRNDGSFEIVVRPESPVSRPLQARAFASRGGDTKSLPVAISPQGSARVAGTVVDLLGSSPSPAEWTITIAIGAAGEVPDSLAGARPRSGLRVIETTVAITN